MRGHQQPSAAMQAVLDRLRVTSAGQPDRYAMPFREARTRLDALREPWLPGGPDGVVRDRVVGGRGRGRDVTVRMVTPVTALDGVKLVYLHGGGWCVGNARIYDNLVRRLAHAACAEAWTIDYALAPESPYPAALDDCLAAIEALVAEVPTTRVVMAGDSAGANLALELALRARDAGHGWPAALLLFYGVYTRGCDDASMQAFGDGRFGYSLAGHRRYLDAYAVPDDATDYAFPLDGTIDLRGLPPTLVMSAELDVLRDQSRVLSDRLREADVRHSHVETAGVTHGFLVYANVLPEAVDAIDVAGRFALLNA